MSALFNILPGVLAAGALVYLCWAYMDYRKMRGGRWW